MKSYEQIIKREAAKRMISKNMDLDYIKEIVELPKKEIKNIYEIKKTMMGEYDYYLRKEYASQLNLIHRFYIAEKTMFFAGCELEKSEIYKNHLIIKTGDDRINREIESMKQYHANCMRLEAMLRVAQHFIDYEILLNALKVPYSWNDDKYKYFEINLYLKDKIKDFELKTMMAKLFSVEENSKKIAFILNRDENEIEEFKSTNSMFFKNNKFNMDKFEDMRLKWENELKTETAMRASYYGDPDEICRYFKLDKNEIWENIEARHDKENENYNVRKTIADKLIKYGHSRQVISEISGIGKFYVTLMTDNRYFATYFYRYYDKFKNEKLIEYKI